MLIIGVGLFWTSQLYPDAFVVRTTYGLDLTGMAAADCHAGTLGTWGYKCSSACPCAAGEGDCNTNADCESGLVCNQNRGSSYGFDAGMDMCEATMQAPDVTDEVPNDSPNDASDQTQSVTPTDCHGGTLGTWNYICSPTCLCFAGEGDCDTDRDCAGPLLCIDGGGKRHGWDAGLDTCEAPESLDGLTKSETTTTPQPKALKTLGSYGYCSSEKPCNAGEGPCKTNSDCVTGVCLKDVGKLFGVEAGKDFCVPAGNEYAGKTMKASGNTYALARSSTLAAGTTMEICGDRADNDGDGKADCADTDCYSDAGCDGQYCDAACKTSGYTIGECRAGVITTTCKRLTQLDSFGLCRGGTWTRPSAICYCCGGTTTNNTGTSCVQGYSCKSDTQYTHCTSTDCTKCTTTACTSGTKCDPSGTAATNICVAASGACTAGFACTGDRDYRYCAAAGDCNSCQYGTCASTVDKCNPSATSWDKICDRATSAVTYICEGNNVVSQICNDNANGQCRKIGGETCNFGCKDGKCLYVKICDIDSDCRVTNEKCIRTDRTRAFRSGKWGECVPKTGADDIGSECSVDCQCANGKKCVNNRCIAADCTSNCGTKACGDDGCGGSCGSCTVPATCDASGNCVDESDSTPGSGPTSTCSKVTRGDSRCNCYCAEMGYSNAGMCFGLYCPTGYTRAGTTDACGVATVCCCNTKTTGAAESICNDKADNDNDGKVDCADPDCTSNTACQPTKPSCSFPGKCVCEDSYLVCYRADCTWSSKVLCGYGCVNGVCKDKSGNPGCSPGKCACNDNSLACYGSDCSVTSTKQCPYGCLNGACKTTSTEGATCTCTSTIQATCKQTVGPPFIRTCDATRNRVCVNGECVDSGSSKTCTPGWVCVGSSQRKYVSATCSSVTYNCDAGTTCVNGQCTKTGSSGSSGSGSSGSGSSESGSGNSGSSGTIPNQGSSSGTTTPGQGTQPSQGSSSSSSGSSGTAPAPGSGTSSGSGTTPGQGIQPSQGSSSSSSGSSGSSGSGSSGSSGNGWDPNQKWWSLLFGW